MPFRTHLWLHLIGAAGVFLGVVGSFRAIAWLQRSTEFKHYIYPNFDLGGILSTFVIFLIFSSLISNFIILSFVKFQARKHGIQNNVWTSGYSGHVTASGSVSINEQTSSTYGSMSNTYAVRGYFLVGMVIALPHRAVIFNDPVQWTDTPAVNIMLRAIQYIVLWPLNYISIINA
jgi:hypothetical protein